MTDYKVRDLQQMCRERGVKGFSRKNKSQLLEMLGLSSRLEKLDKVVRDVYNALFPEDSNRTETRFFTRLKFELENIFQEHQFIISERIGTEFLLSDGKRLSVGGSLQSEYIYPDEIGKLSLKEFEERLAVPEIDPTSEAGGHPLDAKSWIIDHIHIILPRYLEKTFGDYLLWIDEKTAKCRLFNNPRDLFFRDLTFKKRHDQWKIKNSVKTGKMLLGDFILIDRRIEFRFRTSTLVRLLQS